MTLWRSQELEKSVYRVEDERSVDGQDGTRIPAARVVNPPGSFEALKDKYEVDDVEDFGFGRAQE